MLTERHYYCFCCTPQKWGYSNPTPKMMGVCVLPVAPLESCVYSDKKDKNSLLLQIHDKSATTKNYTVGGLSKAAQRVHSKSK